MSSEGIRPFDSKVEAVSKFPQPTTLRQLREFLGLVNFYHRFIPQCANILQPLNDLLSAPKDRKAHIVWTDRASSAFISAKEALANAALLTHPKSSAPTCIQTDASDVAVGAILQQYIAGNWCPMAYFSKKLKPPETRYSTFDRELLAVYLSIKHFSHFVEGREFHVLTDHKPLTFALNSTVALEVTYRLTFTAHRVTFTAYRLTFTAYRLTFTAYRLTFTAYRLTFTAYRLTFTAYRLTFTAFICFFKKTCARTSNWSLPHVYTLFLWPTPV